MKSLPPKRKVILFGGPKDGDIVEVLYTDLSYKRTDVEYHETSLSNKVGYRIFCCNDKVLYI